MPPLPTASRRLRAATPQSGIFTRTTPEPRPDSAQTTSLGSAARIDNNPGGCRVHPRRHPGHRPGRGAGLLDETRARLLPPFGCRLPTRWLRSHARRPANAARPRRSGTDREGALEIPVQCTCVPGPPSMDRTSSVTPAVRAASSAAGCTIRLPARDNSVARSKEISSSGSARGSSLGSAEK